MAHQYEEPSWRDCEDRRILETDLVGDYVTLTDVFSGTVLHIQAEDVPWVVAEMMGEWLAYKDGVDGPDDDDAF